MNSGRGSRQILPMTPPQTHNRVLAKMKPNNRRQVNNREVYTSLDSDLLRMRPDTFFKSSYNSSPIEERQKPFNSRVQPNNYTKGYNIVDPRISFPDNATSSGTSNYAGRQQSLSFDSATESSQSSLSSQGTSFTSSLKGYNPPIASMTDNTESSGIALAEGNKSAIVPQLPAPGRLKRSYSVAAIGKMHRAKRLNGKYDPENHEIMRLRQEEDLDFQEIADKLNEERQKNGGRDDLTDNAVYSRYTRNAPLIAQMKNEKFAPTAKDNQHTKMKFQKVLPISGFNAHEDVLLDVAAQQVQEQFWALVSKRIEELGGGYHDAETCERRFDCL